MDRRNFMKAAGSAALLGMASTLPLHSASHSDEQRKLRIAIFFENNFPSVDGCDVTHAMLADACKEWETSFLSVAQINEQLNASAFDAFVLPFGSAFPKQAANTIFRFLRSGGRFVNIGGTPLAAPIVADGEAWKAEPRQTAYHKVLGITQSFPVATDLITEYVPDPDSSGARAITKEFDAKEIFEFYVRFASLKDFPLEDGSAGPREALLQPLITGVSKDGRRLGVPMLRIKRLQGEFAPGMWVFAPMKGSITAKAIRFMVECALEGTHEFFVQSTFACYRDSETPGFVVTLRSPGASGVPQVAWQDGATP